MFLKSHSAHWSILLLNYFHYTGKIFTVKCLWDWINFCRNIQMSISGIRKWKIRYHYLFIRTLRIRHHQMTYLSLLIIVVYSYCIKYLIKQNHRYKCLWWILKNMRWTSMVSECCVMTESVCLTDIFNLFCWNISERSGWTSVNLLNVVVCVFMGFLFSSKKSSIVSHVILFLFIHTALP